MGCCDNSINIPTGSVGPQGPTGTSGVNGAAVLYNSYTVSPTTQNSTYETLKSYTIDPTDASLPLAATGDYVIVEVIYKQEGFTSLGDNGTRISIDNTPYFSHAGLTFLLPEVMRKFDIKITRKSATTIFVELTEKTYGGLYSSSGFSGGGYQRLDQDHMVYTITVTVSDMDVNGLLIEAEGLTRGTAGDITCDQMIVTSFKKV